MKIQTQIVVVVFVLSVWLSLFVVKTHRLRYLSGCLVLQGSLKQATGVAYHFTAHLTQG